VAAKNEEMNREYQVCTRCVMDTSDPEIEFDEDGACNHCKEYHEVYRDRIPPKERRTEELKRITDKIKEEGKGKKYDCLIGLSGGVDSTYVAYLVKKFGLRPLAVHLDNSWNTELATYNIKKIVNKLKIDFFRHASNWEEFKDLQLSFLKASVVDIELVSDHALVAALYQVADRGGIKYIISGSNIVTEKIMPRSWFHNKNDLVNLKAIHARFGTIKLKSYPTLGIFKKLYYEFVKGIKFVPILDYVDYIRREVKEIIAKELDWEDYGSKHHESIFTRFYQAYILPKKFNIDKRRAHLSTLICSKQITREEALKEIENPAYPEERFILDKKIVLKKLGLTDAGFESIMNLPIRSHLEYRSDTGRLRFLRAVYRIFKKRGKRLKK